MWLQALSNAATKAIPNSCAFDTSDDEDENRANSFRGHTLELPVTCTTTIPHAGNSARRLGTNGETHSLGVSENPSRSKRGHQHRHHHRAA